MVREDFACPVVFPEQIVSRRWPRSSRGTGLRQLHAAETEKYAHVTYFLNGGVEVPWPGEKRLVVPSPRDVPSYDLAPEMSAFKVAAQVAATLDDGYELCVVNFANPDMVGHTGVLPAVVRAVETVDTCLGIVVAATNRRRGVCLVRRTRNARSSRGRRNQPHTAPHADPVRIVTVRCIV